MSKLAKYASPAPNDLLESLGNLLAAVLVRTYHYITNNWRDR